MVNLKPNRRTAKGMASLNGGEVLSLFSQRRGAVRQKTSIELFSGAGGLALATHMAGFQHGGLYEWNKDACATLRANSLACTVPGLSKWHDKITEGDISQVSFDRHEGADLVAGGPPCQPFSMGGKARGMEDPRDMIPHFIRAVREVMPRAFIMENVRGLTRAAFANYLSYTLLQLTHIQLSRKKGETWLEHFHRLQKHHTTAASSTSAHYHVCHEVLNAANYGIPQCRERVFIVGFRTDLDAHWSFPERTHSLEKLLWDQWITGEYWLQLDVPQPRTIPDSVERRLKSLQRPFEGIQPWQTIRQATSGLPKPFNDFDSSGTVFNHRFQPGARPYPGHTGSPYDLPSKALKAGGHGVPGGENMIALANGAYRYLTVREAARVQTFPDSWRFEGYWSEAMRQLGNAVPVDLAKVVATSVASTLDRC